MADSSESNSDTPAMEIDTSDLSGQASELEKQDEAKLKFKYPLAGGAGHSAFLQKKLAKGQKYFDSGDYQMARQTSNIAKTRQVQPLLNFGTGEAIPTPESVPIRKTSIIQPKFQPPPS